MRGNKKVIDCLNKAIRLREALVMPSCAHRIMKFHEILSVRWHPDCITVIVEFEFLNSFQCVMLLWLQTIHWYHDEAGRVRQSIAREWMSGPEWDREVNETVEWIRECVKQRNGWSNEWMREWVREAGISEVGKLVREWDREYMSEPPEWVRQGNKWGSQWSKVSETGEWVREWVRQWSEWDRMMHKREWVRKWVAEMWARENEWHREWLRQGSEWMSEAGEWGNEWGRE